MTELHIFPEHREPFVTGITQILIYKHEPKNNFITMYAALRHFQFQRLK